MVILEGNVINAKKTNKYRTVYVNGATLTQGSGWVVTTNNSGYFYTSANTQLDELSMQASGFVDVTISIPVFATMYDPQGVISGTLTANANVTAISGSSILTDTGKIFIPNSLVGRTVTMMNGVDDGLTGIIFGNTVNTMEVGGAIGGSIITSTSGSGLQYFGSLT